MMKRFDFLKRMVSSGLLLTLPKAVNAIGTVLVEESTYVYVPVYESFIAGFQYYEGKKLLSEMKTNDPLDLVREPDNPYDSKAVAVYWNGQKLGFMPQFNNDTLSMMLDARIPCTASIKAIFPNRAPWEMLEFEIFLAYPKMFLAEKGS